MKKLLIVNNNLKVGGVQKSLYNLLWSLEGDYDITLCLFKNIGDYSEKLPKSVKVTETKGLFRYLGVSQSEVKGLDGIKRAILAAVSRMLGRKFTLKLLLLGEKMHDDNYDCAISFLHNGKDKSFYGFVQDYVIHRVKADRKIAFLHCDYRNCGANNSYNNELLKRFDKIAACSDGCREAFLSVLPEMESRCVTVKNFHRYEEIRRLANEQTVEYKNDCVNLLTVARLSHEKGIDRAIKAFAKAIENGIAAKLHIVGDGAKRNELEELVKTLGLTDSVVFYGEQSNPYRFMKNADLLLLTSYHEAAPMVIDEARSLGLPILSTSTTSSQDMILDSECGWVCDNSQDKLNTMLVELTKNIDTVKMLKKSLADKKVNNDEARLQFDNAIILL
ncbi:MAG: glycosyltransferase [Ruminococcaceae bacterium]|nr:glycosyltransferase [Oscillospiraceae bacterium]